MLEAMVVVTKVLSEDEMVTDEFEVNLAAALEQIHSNQSGLVQLDTSLHSGSIER